MKPVVSIIIPVYNVEPYIEECLDSVKNQTVPDKIECIVVDDCGTDKSASIAQRIIEEYQGSVTFRFIKREKNGGLSAARNSGLKVASGKYVYFLDSDDYLIPTAIETLMALADKYGEVDLLPALYLTSGNRDMSQFNQSSFPEYSENLRLIKRSLLDYDCIPVTAANRLIRRELILENNLWFKEGIIHEDNYWTFFLTKHVKRMAFCSQPLYFYRETPGSITKAKNISKETFAFQTMVGDFLENIDAVEVGAQKRFIFLHLLIMLNHGYFNDAVDKEKTLAHFLRKCSWLERMFLFLAFKAKGIVRNKSINLVQRLFLR